MRVTMHFFPTLALAAFVLCSTARAALQPDNALADSLNLPGQTAQEGVADYQWSVSCTHPAGRFYVAVHFPQGFGEPIDASLAALSRKRFDETFQALSETAGENTDVRLRDLSASGRRESPPEQVAMREPLYSVSTYEVTRPSENYASVHFSETQYTGGAHGNRTHSVVSYDLRQGKMLELGDLFTGGEAGPAFIARIADGVQAIKDKQAEPVDRSPEAIDASMKRIALTRDGVRVIYAPYEMGSYAEGEFMVDIPKADLISMGARPQIWQ